MTGQAPEERTYRIEVLGFPGLSTGRVAAELARVFDLKPRRALHLVTQLPSKIRSSAPHDHTQRYVAALLKLGGDVRVKRLDTEDARVYLAATYAGVVGDLIIELPAPKLSGRDPFGDLPPPNDDPPAPAPVYPDAPNDDDPFGFDEDPFAGDVFAGDTFDDTFDETPDVDGHGSTPDDGVVDLSAPIQEPPRSGDLEALSMMNCPRCGTKQVHGETCIYCGIIYAKYLARQSGEQGVAPPLSPAPLAGDSGPEQTPLLDQSGSAAEGTSGLAAASAQVTGPEAAEDGVLHPGSPVLQLLRRFSQRLGLELKAEFWREVDRLKWRLVGLLAVVVVAFAMTICGG